jgi:hypothetical protein
MPPLVAVSIDGNVYSSALAPHDGFRIAAVIFSAITFRPTHGHSFPWISLVAVTVFWASGFWCASIAVPENIFDLNPIAAVLMIVAGAVLSLFQVAYGIFRRRRLPVAVFTVCLIVFFGQMVLRGLLHWPW